jgi:hypothetical protein
LEKLISAKEGNPIWTRITPDLKIGRNSSDRAPWQVWSCLTLTASLFIILCDFADSITKAYLYLSYLNQIEQSQKVLIQIYNICFNSFPI